MSRFLLRKATLRLIKIRFQSNSHFNSQLIAIQMKTENNSQMKRELMAIQKGINANINRTARHHIESDIIALMRLLFWPN